MIRRAIGFVVALALTVIGGGGTIFLLFFAERFRVFMLVGCAVMLFVGAYWLWIDYLSPGQPEKTSRAPSRTALTTSNLPNPSRD